jgi:hypothetical protein
MIAKRSGEKFLTTIYFFVYEAIVYLHPLLSEKAGENLRSSQAARQF